MTISKDVTVTYNEFEDLLAREEKMVATLKNYLSKNQDYEFTGTVIEYTEDGKYLLRLKVQAKI